MQIEKTSFEGLLVLRPKVFRDERGFFMETFRADFFERLGLEQPFIQDNHVRSEEKGVLRGLHFQLPPQAQTKLVSVVRGAIFDVVVDLRRVSPTYGKWQSFVLSAENQQRLLVPKGFAHGYMTLEEGTEVQYKVDAYYAPLSDSGILWNDPDLAIIWPDFSPRLSEKDQCLRCFREFSTPF
jgi:dTDP-4-dehydrorhamnose 3,5-epimerase